MRTKQIYFIVILLFINYKSIAQTTGSCKSCFNSLPSSSTGINNTAFGINSLLVNSSGYDNTGFGTTTLGANTTGMWNSAFGSNAMYSNTTGYSNSAFGYQALNSNTTGYHNSAFGNNALPNNTTGDRNNALGVNALNSNTTGRSNNAFGTFALGSNTTGISNSAFGTAALYKNTTGSNNVAFGYGALTKNTSTSDLPKSGTSNTAVGWEALKYNTTGWQNTAVGESALTSNTTGQHNTGIGEDVLNNNTSGIGNSALGESAIYQNNTGSFNLASGYYALNNTIGSRNIAIGTLSGFKRPYKSNGTPQTYTGDDNIYIGYICPTSNHGTNSESRVIRLGNMSDVQITRPISTTFQSTQSTYIAGIYNTTLTSSPSQVYITSDGQLGIQSSSIQFKEDVKSIDLDPEDFMKLNPVSFRYKSDVENIKNPIQYGLIAEELKNIIPEMVQTDNAGEPYTVSYQFLAPLLLAQVQKDHKALDDQKEIIQTLQEKNNHLTKELAVLKQQVSKLISEKR